MARGAEAFEMYQFILFMSFPVSQSFRENGGIYPWDDILGIVYTYIHLISFYIHVGYLFPYDLLVT